VSFERRIIIVWVPLGEAEPATIAAFEEFGERFRVWETNVPARWECRLCGEEFEVRQLGLGYEASLGVPVCPTNGCAGHGFELIRPAREQSASG
jgi:rubredoxin